MACFLAPPAMLAGLAAAARGPAVDHVGVVVRDLGAEVAAWRAAGFFVSDPVPLMGTAADGSPVALGQASAHVVFENAYVELSSPVPGSGNHLEPYLEHGEGVRILVLATQDAAAARAALVPAWPAISPVREASRIVAAGEAQGTATFLWFPLPWDVVPGVLCALVEHRSRALVLHPSLARHPNGLRRIDAVVAEGQVADLRAGGLAQRAGDSPPLLIGPGEGVLRVTRLALSGTQEKILLQVA